MSETKEQMLARQSIKVLEGLVKIQCKDGNWNYSRYMFGMANGMILALAMIKNETPEYLDAPDVWGEDIPGTAKPVAAIDMLT